jgi:hypothetical protein
MLHFQHGMLRCKQEMARFLLGIRVTGAHSRAAARLNFLRHGKSPRLPVCRHVGSATETQRHRVWPQIDTDETRMSRTANHAKDANLLNHQDTKTPSLATDAHRFSSIRTTLLCALELWW